MAVRREGLSFRGLPSFSFSYAVHKNEAVPTKKARAIACNNYTRCHGIDVSAEGGCTSEQQTA